MIGGRAMLIQINKSPFEVYCDDSLERARPEDLHEALGDVCWLMYNVRLQDSEELSRFEVYVIEEDPETGQLFSRVKPKDEVKKKAIEEMGRTMQFGRYPQNSDTPEPITWRIIDIYPRWVLLISEQILDCRPYNEPAEGVDREKDEGACWKDSSLREWLNRDFLQMAFTEEERKRLDRINCRTQNNRKYDTYGGPSTDDYVCLLNEEEAKEFFGNDPDRRAEATAYAEKKGLYVTADHAAGWWLRTPGDTLANALYVTEGGDIDKGVGHWVGDDEAGGVRPVIRL